jgi:hypothetical protein
MHLESKIPRLARPVLIVPGGQASHKALPGIWRALTRGRDNRFGGDWELSRRDDFVQPAGDENVFTLAYSKPFNTYAANAGEVQAAVDDIRTRTGAKEVDVVGECKGAEEVRELIRQGARGIRNVIYVTPMNHGLPGLGDAAHAIAGTICGLHLPWPKLKVKYLDGIFDGQKRPETMATLQALGGDWHVGRYHNNPALEALNTPESLAHERASVHSITVVAGRGFGLGGFFPSRLFSGDTAVPQYSSFMPTAENFYYPVKHAQETSSRKLLDKIVETLVTDGHPARDSHYTTSVPQPHETVLGRALTGVAKLFD